MQNHQATAFSNKSHLSPKELRYVCMEILGFDERSLENPLPDLQLLTEIYSRYVQNVAFSSVRALLVPCDKLTVASIDEVKKHGLRRQAAMCYQTNVFLSWVLMGFGYEVYKIYRAECVKEKPNNHLALVVRVNETDYLLDGGTAIGMACPPVPLNFNGESDIYQAAIWKCTYVKTTAFDKADYIKCIFQRTDDTRHPLHERPLQADAEWSVLFQGGLIYYTLEEVQDAMRITHENLELSPIQRRLVIYSFPSGRLKMLRNTVFMSEEEDGSAKEINLENKEQIVAIMKEQFGQFHKEDKLSLAVDRFFEYQGEAEMMKAKL